MIQEAITALALMARPRAAILENPQYGLSDPAVFDFLGAGLLSEAGTRVNHDISLSLAPVWQAVGMISGDAGAMPRELYRRLPDGDREIATNHPARFLVSTEWNNEYPAFDGWRRLFAHALLWQNGYAYIERKGRFGPPLSLTNLLPDRTKPMRDKRTGELVYITEVDGEPWVLYKEEVLHLKGLSIKPGIGADLVHHARNCFGLALAAESYGSKFFANGAQAAGVIMVPASFSEKAVQNLEEGFRKRTSKDNWFKIAILRDGSKFESVSIDAQKAQLKELREDQVRDVARFFNLPPFKLGVAGSVSYNSTEQGQLVYLQSALSHWLMASKTEAQMKLLTLAERKAGQVYLGHNILEWLELDTKTQNEVLEIQRRNEVINANEWRQVIHRNRRADPGGDEYVNPNTKSVQPGQPGSGSGSSDAPDPNDPSKAGKPIPPPPAPPAQAVRRAHRDLLADAINRAARRLCFDATTASKKPGKFLAWLDGGALDHRKVFDDSLRPSVTAYCSVFSGDVEAVQCDLAGRFFAAILTDLKPLLEPPHLATDLECNVTAACLHFEATISDKLLAFISKE